MKIERQRLVEIIQEELRAINESDDTTLPELEGIDFDNPESSFKTDHIKNLQPDDRGHVYDVLRGLETAIGIGEVPKAFRALVKSKLAPESDLKIIRKMFKKYHEIYKRTDPHNLKK